MSDIQIWYVLMSLADYDTSCIYLCDLLLWCVYCSTWCWEPNLLLLLWAPLFHLWVHCTSSTGMTVVCLYILFPCGLGISNALAFQITCLSSFPYGPLYVFAFIVAVRGCMSSISSDVHASARYFVASLDTEYRALPLCAIWASYILVMYW